MTREEARKLIERYLAGKCTDEEKKLVENFYQRESDIRGFTAEPSNPEAIRAEMWDRIAADVDSGKTKRMRVSWLAAASATVAMLTVLYFMYRGKPDAFQGKTVIAEFDQRVSPGRDMAYLTLPDGRRLELEGQDGVVVLDKGVFSDSGGNTLADSESQAESALNHVSTPKGGQYRVQLPDGSLVWLNAMSSVVFPTEFGNKREIGIEGEAYIQVARDASRPFSIITRGTHIDVLGTRFLVSAYGDDDPFSTTLLSGSIKVSVQGNSRLLLPGQRAELHPDGKGFSVTTADTTLLMAWTTGIFSFRDVDLKDLMKTLARWYDFDVEYEGKLPDNRFSGKLMRNDNASKILDLLEYYGVKYHIDGKRLIIEGEP